MVHGRLTPDLVITTYRGSPVTFFLTPTADGDPIANLDEYDQLDFSIWSGTRESPEARVLPLRYTGSAPLYITVGPDGNGNPAALINIPADASGNLAAGQYFAEFWITPPGGEATFTGWALWNHEPTTFGAA